MKVIRKKKKIKKYKMRKVRNKMISNNQFRVVIIEKKLYQLFRNTQVNSSLSNNRRLVSKINKILILMSSAIIKKIMMRRGFNRCRLKV